MAADAGQVRAHRVQVEEVHRQRVVDLLADLEGGRGRDRPDDQVDLLEGPVEVLADQAPHLEGLLVIGVVVAGLRA